MNSDILVPAVGSLAFLSVGIAWTCAVLFERSWWSRTWYGGKWAERFSNQNKRNTLLRASGFAAFYIMTGMAALLSAVRAADQSANQGISVLQWILFVAGIIWFITAMFMATRLSK